jgi:UDP-N-acetylglucosamine diphosphorylase / glucose-1-phosphate thymidylyltransferase / UDP-N-acetylgalactosamine diphosphorylase / glucosamine-1-phosphate N-acetyltransferase / galactosamine-1-phosphate N-acetyltransferase
VKLKWICTVCFFFLANLRKFPVRDEIFDRIFLHCFYNYWVRKNMNPHSIILVESASEDGSNDSNRSFLYPFSILHPAYELRCGALRLVEKLERHFPDSRIVVHTLDHRRLLQQRSFCERFPHFATPFAATDGGNSSTTLVLSAHILPTTRLLDALSEAAEAVFAAEGRDNSLVVRGADGAGFAAWIPNEAYKKFAWADGNEGGNENENDLLARFDSLFYADSIGIGVQNLPDTHITQLWDALRLNAEAIEDDAEYFTMNGAEELGKFAGVYGIMPENISIGAAVRIAPCVVLDASNGVIIIDDGVEIQPHVSIVGPCYIGKHSLVKAGTRFYEGTSLGEHCKVGGEIKNTIFQAFSNKQHDGCLGYSFIGEWVNLGAGTNVSDLKNNYGVIRSRFFTDQTQEISTGMRSLGLLAGCHTKSAINTTFNTGTVTGISANVFGGKPDKYVPSFSWGGTADAPLFEIEKVVELARTVMERRSQELMPSEEELLRLEFARAQDSVARMEI